MNDPTQSSFEDLVNQENPEQEIEQQNPQVSSLQMLIGLVGATLIERANKKKTEKFFRENKTLNLDRLLNDPKYFKELQMHLGRLHSYGFLMKDIPPDTKDKLEHALNQGRKISEGVSTERLKFSNSYSAGLQQTYGLDDKQLENVIKRAQKRVSEKNVSMSDSLKAEARRIVKNRVSQEVNRDQTINKENRNAEITRRLSEYDQRFDNHTQTKEARFQEGDVARQIEENGRQGILRTSGSLFEEKQPAQPEPAPTPAALPTPPSTSQSQPTLTPIPMTPPSVPPQTALAPAPTPAQPSLSLPSQPASTPSSVSKATKLPLPSTLSNRFQGLSRFLNNIENKINSIRNSIGTRLAKTSLGSFFNGLKNRLLNTALLKGLGGLVSGGALTALSIGSDVLKGLTGIDLTSMGLTVAKIVIIITVGVIVLLFLGLTSNLAAPCIDNCPPIQ